MINDSDPVKDSTLVGHVADLKARMKNVEGNQATLFDLTSSIKSTTAAHNVEQMKTLTEIKGSVSSIDERIAPLAVMVADHEKHKNRVIGYLSAVATGGGILGATATWILSRMNDGGSV